MVKFTLHLVPILLVVTCFSLTSSGPVLRPKDRPDHRTNSAWPVGRPVHPPVNHRPAGRFSRSSGSPPAAAGLRRTPQKRAANENFFEDDDGGKSNNVDYIDFSNLYKDEVANGKNREKFELEAKNKKRMVKNRREKNKEKKKRKKKRKNKQSRFKRRDDDPTDLAALNGGGDRGMNRPATKLISLECEDRLHCLIRQLANGENKQASADEKKLNKLLDELLKSDGKTAQLPITSAKNKITDADAAAKKRPPNYFGNFHLVIRIPKDRNLSELQNLALVPVNEAKHQSELEQKLERLQKLVEGLTNQMKANSHKKIGGGNFASSDPDASLDRLEINQNEELTRNGFDRIKGDDRIDSSKSFDPNFRRLLCPEKMVNTARLCYFAS